MSRKNIVAAPRRVGTPFHEIVTHTTPVGFCATQVITKTIRADVRIFLKSILTW